MKVGIVVPVINQYEKALKGLASVRTKYDWEPFIIPNWECNYSVPRSYNTGIDWAIGKGCDYIILANDDIVYSPFTVDSLVDLIEDHNIVVANGDDIREYLSPKEVLSLKSLEENIQISEDCGISACSMIRPSFIKDIGYLDENFFPGYYEDGDLSYRIKLLGHKTLRTTAAPYYHYGSSSQNAFLHEGRPIVHGDAFMANHDYLVRKWGSDDPSKIVFTHPFNDPDNDPREWKPEWRPR